MALEERAAQEAQAIMVRLALLGVNAGRQERDVRLTIAEQVEVAIRNAVAEAQGQRWIPVGEQALDEGLYAVICKAATTDRYLSTSQYHPFHGWEIEAFEDFLVRYYCPLPPLPEN